jgi:hypothetical protein
MIGINVGVPVPREPFSFGGIQDSKFGHGDITGPSSVEFWSQLKKVTTKWAVQPDTTWMGLAPASPGRSPARLARARRSPAPALGCLPPD